MAPTTGCLTLRIHLWDTEKNPENNIYYIQLSVRRIWSYGTERCLGIRDESPCGQVLLELEPEGKTTRPSYLIPTLQALKGTVSLTNLQERLFSSLTYMNTLVSLFQHWLIPSSI